MPSLLDDIQAFLKTANKREKTQFIDQLLKEKALSDALREAGLPHTLEEIQAKARERPEGVLTQKEILDRIDTISLVETISLIDEITKVGEISTIGGILSSIPHSLIVNPSFEQDFTGYVYAGNVSIGSLSHYGKKSAQFKKDEWGWVQQIFPIPLEVDSLQELSLRLKSYPTAGEAITVIYYYADTSKTYEHLATAGIGSFEKKTLSPSAGKFIECLELNHKHYISDIPFPRQTNVDDIFTVLKETIVLMHGWDTSAWKKLRCDPDGYLLTKAAP